jgi:rhodanese-related sulfurtransferase
MQNKSGADLITEAKSRTRQISIDEIKRSLGAADAPLLLDVREPQETNLGRLPGAIVIPRGTMETRVEAVIPREASVVIYCASDNRSALAADTLMQMGYAQVAWMKGGFNGWAVSGGPVAS